MSALTNMQKANSPKPFFLILTDTATHRDVWSISNILSFYGDTLVRSNSGEPSVPYTIRDRLIDVAKGGRHIVIVVRPTDGMVMTPDGWPKRDSSQPEFKNWEHSPVEICSKELMVMVERYVKVVDHFISSVPSRTYSVCTIRRNSFDSFNNTNERYLITTVTNYSSRYTVECINDGVNIDEYGALPIKCSRVVKSLKDIEDWKEVGSYGDRYPINFNKDDCTEYTKTKGKLHLAASLMLQQ